MKLDAERGRGSFSRVREKAGMRVPRAAPTLTPALSRPAGEGALRFMRRGSRAARWSNSDDPEAEGARYDFDACLRCQFQEDVLGVRLDRLRRDAKLLGDALVR